MCASCQILLKSVNNYFVETRIYSHMKKVGEEEKEEEEEEVEEKEEEEDGDTV